MKRCIWILNHYASDMYFSHGGRHYWFAKYLRRAGYNPVVFCCNSAHNSNGKLHFDMDRLWEEHVAKEIETPFVFVQGRPYTGNAKQRVLNMIDFYCHVKRAAREYATAHGVPDVIYASSVHPLTLVAGIQLAKQFGVRCVCEVRDLWPESLVVYGIAGPKNPAVLVLRRLEKWIYKKADAVVFTMEGAYDYIREQGWEKAVPRDKVFYINNGVDLELFDKNREQFQIEDPDLDNPELFKAVYTGSIRRVNNLGLLLDAAKEVKNPRVKFLIWGAGDELEQLRARVENERIGNVVFKGRVDKNYVPSIASRADVNLLHGKSSPLLRFGVSPNKLFDYLAAGKPVLTDFPCPYNPSVQAGAGVYVDDQTPENIAAAVEALANAAPAEYERMCENARRAAEEYDFRRLTEKLIAVIEGRKPK